MKARFFLSTSLFVLASLVCSHAADLSKLPAPSDKTGLTYAEHIKPLFDRSCVKCHGVERARAGLRMDSREGVLKGTRRKQVVLPGKSAESTLVHGIAKATTDPDLWMPPEGKADPLTTEEIALVRAWIDQGAK